MILSAEVGAGCAEEPVRVPVRLELVAEDSAVVVGRTLSFRATAYDRQGREVPVGPLEWSVSDTVLGRIGPDGVFRAGPGPGDGRVFARLVVEKLWGSAGIHVAVPGEVKWRYAATAGVFGSVGSMALGPDGTVFVVEDIDPRSGSLLSALVVLSASGQLRWRRDLPGIHNNYPVVTPAGPIVVAGQRIHAVSPGGALLWEAPTNETLSEFASAAATDERLVAPVGFDAFCYSLSSPSILWSAPRAPLGSWLVPPTIDAAGRVYVKHSRDTLFAFRLSDGGLVRTYQDPDSLPDNRVFGVGAVPVGSRVYMPTASRLAAFDTSGVLLWFTKTTGLGVTEPAVAENGDLYVQQRADGLWALRGDGTQRWRFPVAVPRWTWYGGPALARNGIIYAAAQDGLYAVSSTGQMLWRFEADSAGVPQAFIGAPAIAPDGTVYSYTATHLYAFWGPEPPEPNSPWPMWRHDAQRTGWAR